MALVTGSAGAALLGFEVTPDGRWVDVPLDAALDLEQWAGTTAQLVLVRRGRIASGAEHAALVGAWVMVAQRLRHRVAHDALSAGIVAAIAHVPADAVAPVAVADVVAVRLPWMPGVTGRVDREVGDVFDELLRGGGRGDLDAPEVRALGQILAVDVTSWREMAEANEPASELARDLDYTSAYVWRVPGAASYAALLASPCGNGQAAAIGEEQQAFDELARSLEQRITTVRDLSLSTVLSLMRAAEARTPIRLPVSMSNEDYVRLYPANGAELSQQSLAELQRPPPSWGQRWRSLGRALVPMLAVALVLGVAGHVFATSFLGPDSGALQVICSLALMVGVIGVVFGMIFWAAANALAPKVYETDLGQRAMPLSILALGVASLGLFAGTVPALLDGGSLF